MDRLQVIRALVEEQANDRRLWHRLLCLEGPPRWNIPWWFRCLPLGSPVIQLGICPRTELRRGESFRQGAPAGQERRQPNPGSRGWEPFLNEPLSPCQQREGISGRRHDDL